VLQLQTAEIPVQDGIGYIAISDVVSVGEDQSDRWSKKIVAHMTVKLAPNSNSNSRSLGPVRGSVFSISRKVIGGSFASIFAECLSDAA
jgi:hypothetical protein